MAEKITYRSSIADWITGFLEEKRAMGYKYQNEAKWMRLFDVYWAGHGYIREGLSIDTTAEWLQKRESEGAKCLATRVSVIRQYSMYLNGLGISSYCPPVGIHCPKAVIHLPTPEEIAALFSRIDSYSPKKGSTNIRRMGMEYPILFRLIYLNGLRASEACLMPMENVDLTAGTAIVSDGKGNRDRIVYFSADMAELCRRYAAYLSKELGRMPEWLFPGIDPHEPISYGSVSSMFRRCWKETFFSAGCDRNPTTHCLRHAYVVNRINLWRESGIDFGQMLPYLSRFVGHKDFRETYYYYHYTEDAAQTIREKDTVISRVVPEVMRR